MGIYDEYRDSNASINLAGNKAAAAAFIPTARKFAEVMQGKLDLGANLGMDYKKGTVKLDDNTTMSIKLSPGVTNSTMQIEISSSLPTAPTPTRGRLAAGTRECPPLPLSAPGARVFTQLFGHDVLGEVFPNNVFTQTAAVTVKTSPALAGLPAVRTVIVSILTVWLRSIDPRPSLSVHTTISGASLALSPCSTGYTP